MGVHDTVPYQVNLRLSIVIKSGVYSKNEKRAGRRKDEGGEKDKRANSARKAY